MEAEAGTGAEAGTEAKAGADENDDQTLGENSIEVDDEDDETPSSVSSHESFEFDDDEEEMETKARQSPQRADGFIELEERAIDKSTMEYYPKGASTEKPALTRTKDSDGKFTFTIKEGTSPGTETEIENSWTVDGKTVSEKLILDHQGKITGYEIKPQGTTSKCNQTWLNNNMSEELKRELKTEDMVTKLSQRTSHDSRDHKKESSLITLYDADPDNASASKSSSSHLEPSNSASYTSLSDTSSLQSFSPPHTPVDAKTSSRKRIRAASI